MTSDEISERLMQLWGVMDACIRDGVSSSALPSPSSFLKFRLLTRLVTTVTAEETLPGRLKVRRRAPALYRRLFKGGLLCQGARTSSAALIVRIYAGFYPSVTSPKPSPTPIAPPSASSAQASSSKSTLSLASGIGGRSPASTSPSSASLAAANVSRSPRALTTGSFDHPLPVTPWKQATFPGIDFLSCYVRALSSVALVRLLN
jgi:hypothetical protein